MATILERLNNTETCMDAIDDAIDIIEEMQAIIKRTNVLNKTLPRGGSHLWDAGSQLQARIDKVLAEVEE